MSLIGRIAGISGIVWGSFTATAGDKAWRWLFLAGLIGGTVLYHRLTGTAYPTVPTNLPLALVAGLIVGVGVKLGNGCTSGHGVCGMGRFSTRSIAATMTFMGVAIGTVAVSNLLGVN
jgi:uncharacterized membrane protein YedE/YeeE